MKSHINIYYLLLLLALFGVNTTCFSSSNEKQSENSVVFKSTNSIKEILGLSQDNNSEQAKQVKVEDNDDLERFDLVECEIIEQSLKHKTLSDLDNFLTAYSYTYQRHTCLVINKVPLKELYSFYTIATPLYIVYKVLRI